MTFCFNNQKKITVKKALKKVIKKSLFFLLAFLFIFSAANAFFNATIHQNSLSAEEYQVLPETPWPKNYSERFA